MPQATSKAPAPPATTPHNPAQPVAVAAPLTPGDLDALVARRNELSSELSSMSGHRSTLSKELARTQPGPDRTGIEARISQLDGQLISMQSDLANVGGAIAAAPSYLQHTTSTGIQRPYGQPSANQMTGITIVGIIFVLCPLSIAFARLMFRRAARPPAPQIPKEVADRLERMEQGIEAVALEVERIGEGQRFVTQLMGDRAQRAALPEGVRRTP